MDYVRKYGELIKDKAVNHPETARSMIKLGLKAENTRTKLLPDKEMPKAFRMLTHMAMDNVLAALEHPERSCWTNIFAPVEIMQCFGLQCISMECLSSFMSGFKIEDYLIDYAENEGIAPTLCSYHKNFIGGVDAGLLPKAAMSVTTSMICDGNINTFRHMETKHGVESYVIDVPHEYSPEAEQYVVSQLKELIALLEKKTGKKMDMEALKETIRRENESKACYKAFLKEQKHRYYPNTMTLDLYMLFATHLDIGTPKVLEFFRLLKKDVKTYPEFNGKGILWVHLMPYYQETLQQYLNYQEKYYIQACDMNLDYMEEMDAEHPLEALARKMLLNIYNGPYERKQQMVRRLVEEFQSDAVINFCHWGCKQSSGGVMLLKEEMRKAGVPMLILDGDAMDRRNSHDGQIKTRLQAFLELLDNAEGTGTSEDTTDQQGKGGTGAC
jgi:benzoyl-CoA reductase/2-hydroxyglutaryl-CoA dehydratase subunit BcrC/BadD/HgdB